MSKQTQIIAIGGIIVVVLLAYKLFSGSTPAPFSLFPASAASVANGWQKMVSANSAHIASTLELALPNSMQKANQPIVNVTIKTEGDASWQEKPFYIGTFTIETKGRGMQLFTDGDLHVLPDKTLFKLHNLPTILNPSGNLLGKWNNVDAPLLRLTNAEQVMPAFESLFSNWNYIGKDSSMNYFTKTVTAEEEGRLESVLNFQASGGEALHIMARLLKYLTIDKAEAWTDASSGELRQLKFHFKNAGKPENEATLQWNFSDFGKEVSADTPAAEANIEPSVFSQLFGEPKPSPTPTPKKR